MKPPLDLLHTFVVFSRTQSVSGTAKLLHLSQPAVSIQLSKLEGFYQRALFTQEGKRKKLSKFGERLSEMLEPKIADLDRVHDEAQILFDSPENVTIRVGGRPEILSYLGPKIDFAGTIIYKGMATDKAVDAILRHRVDMAVSHYKPDASYVIAKRLFVNRGVLVYSRSFAKKHKAKELKDFKTLPYIAYRHDNDPFLLSWTEHLKSDPTSIPIKIALENWNTIVNMVSKGYGYSVVPSSIDIPEGLESKELSTRIVKPQPFWLLYRRDYRQLDWFDEIVKQATVT